jgi:hypothetical protein
MREAGGAVCVVVTALVVSPCAGEMSAHQARKQQSGLRYTPEHRQLANKRRKPRTCFRHHESLTTSHQPLATCKLPLVTCQLLLATSHLLKPASATSEGTPGGVSRLAAERWFQPERAGLICAVTATRCVGKISSLLTMNRCCSFEL